MPSVMRFDGLRVVIYVNDHSPEHVHVIGANREAVFELECPDGPVALRESFRFTRQELRRVIDRLDAVVLELCEAWEKIHGPD